MFRPLHLNLHGGVGWVWDQQHTQTQTAVAQRSGSPNNLRCSPSSWPSAASKPLSEPISTSVSPLFVELGAQVHVERSGDAGLVEG